MATGCETAGVAVCEDGDLAVGTGGVLRPKPFRTEVANGNVGGQVPGQDRLSGVDECFNYGGLWRRRGEFAGGFRRRGANGSFEMGDGITQVHGSRPAFFEVIETRVDIGNRLVGAVCF